MFVQLIIMTVFGGICAMIAHAKGRSPVGWFFIGFFFSLLGLIICCVMSDLKAEEERHARLERQNRRLREQLRKDRQVAARRHQGLQRRLGAHDRALSMDTSDPPVQEIGFDEDSGDPDDVDIEDEERERPPARPRRLRHS